NSDQLRYTTTVESSMNFPLGEAGLNQSAGNIYLTEAYALPYRGCWSVFGAGKFNCDWEYIKGSAHIDIGSELLLDVLPATIGEFMDVESWGGGQISSSNGTNATAPAFPMQRDQDNDGLLNQVVGGADPDDSTADTDGDGVSDLMEITHGTDPLNPDTDGDGLSDADEIVWHTHPLR